MTGRGRKKGQVARVGHGRAGGDESHALDPISEVAEQCHPHLAPKQELERAEACDERLLPRDDPAARSDDAHVHEGIRGCPNQDRGCEKQIEGDDVERHAQAEGESLPGGHDRSSRRLEGWLRAALLGRVVGESDTEKGLARARWRR